MRWATSACHTLEALLEEGHDVVAFDLESPRARKLASRLDGRVRVVWGDITDPLSIRAALDGVDAVVHLAGIVPPRWIGRPISPGASTSTGPGA